MNVLVGAWPVGAILAAVVLRMLADEVRETVLSDEPDDRPIRRRDRILLELLTAAGQAFVVAAGVGFGIAWSPFRW